jgi:hypothetical protein
VSDRPVIGWREWIGLPDLGVPWVKAKVDTGARSSSLHAWDVDVDERDAVVRFAVHPFQHDDEIAVVVRAPLLDVREFRSSNGDVERRPVIGTRAALAGVVAPIEVSLTNRDEMGFRMLLGRTAVRRRFLVDPGRSFRGGGTRHEPPGG